MTTPNQPLPTAAYGPAPASTNGNGAHPAEGPTIKPNPLKDLIAYFNTTHTLIHCAGSPYAVPRMTQDQQTAINGTSGMPDNLAALYRDITIKMTGTPGVAQGFGASLRRKIVSMSWAVKGIGVITKSTADTVMLNLEAEAFRGREVPLGLRFQQPSPDRIYVDLGREDGKCIEITPGDWRIVSELPPTVVFRRSHAIHELPLPVRGGRIDDLAPLLAMKPDDAGFKLLVGWILGLPFSASVRPGVLVIGQAGAGKSTRLRLATSIWEPSGVASLGSSFGNNTADDQVRALHRAVPLWDNLTAVSGTASDSLCQIVTGTAKEGRQLYSDAELVSNPICRPVGLTAVGIPAGLRPDALDRLITLDLPAVQARVEDSAVQARFEQAHPQLLGAFCDAVAAALEWRGLIVAPTEFRMAAYAGVLKAIDTANEIGELQGCPTGLLATYTVAVHEAKQRTVAEDVFGGPLLALLERDQRVRAGVTFGAGRLAELEKSKNPAEHAMLVKCVASCDGQWAGKASELLDALRYTGGQVVDTTAPGWPRTAKAVQTTLAHLRNGLEELGVTWTTTTVRGSTRYYFMLRGEPLVQTHED